MFLKDGLCVSTTGLQCICLSQFREPRKGKAQGLNSDRGMLQRQFGRPVKNLNENYAIRVSFFPHKETVIGQTRRKFERAAGNRSPVFLLLLKGSCLSDEWYIQFPALPHIPVYADRLAAWAFTKR